MARLKPAPPEQYEPVYGPEAAIHQRIFANVPGMATAFADFSAAVLREHRTLPPRLTELVRLRVAFHNQCRSCMAARYLPSDEVSEALVCSLERPYEADDLTDAERAALAYADALATNHLSVDDETYDALRRHFSEAEIVELGMQIAIFVGFGRLEATWDMVDELPERFRRRGVVITPWGGEE
jgi:alkylhydroperoxidase family enzyme